MHLLQSFDIDAPHEVEPMYFRTKGDNERDVQKPTFADGKLVLAPGETTTFDSYFNAFFENCWFGFSALESVTLRMSVSGSCTVTLWRRTPQLDNYELDRRVVDSDTAIDVEFAIRDDAEFRAEAGRVWVEVQNHGNAIVHGGGWFGNEDPVREVALGVVFCTFNREKYLRRILQSIDSHQPAAVAAARVFVVNQGNSFSATEILGGDLSLASKLTIIEQPNLGGCGGFTRGIHETVKDPSLTHFVLLDDDSRIHADSIHRARAFLSYCEDDVVLGGHMLNLHRPLFLEEAGANLNESSLQPEPLKQGSWLGDSAGMESLLRMGPADYNGWWFFAASKAVVDDIGYPMPCFIRGDDTEYGMRLQRRGYRTVPVPGIAVWHEPFYLKLGGWQLFFEVRNRLMFASLHEDTDWSGLVRELGKVFARDLSMSRYHSAKLIIEAIADYRKGPQACFRTDDAALRRARAIVDEFGPERVDQPNHVESRSERVRQRDAARQRLLKVTEAAERRFNKLALPPRASRRLAWSLREGKGEAVYRAADLVPYRVAQHRQYVVVEEQGMVAWRFTHDVALERQLWREFSTAVRGLVRNPAFRAYQTEQGEWVDWWEELYATIPAPE